MKTSIIVLTHNKLEYTKLCVESINQFTRKGTYELIIVDNNSTDGTVEWLREQDDIKVIYNQENMGFPKGCNQGIFLAEGDNILLLNNDTIVTHNWLENLINVLYSSDEIGAVGPITNSCSYYQAIDVTYKSIEEMHEFSRNKNMINNDLWEERLKLIGFCMLIKKEVIDKIGLLDERFSPGNFEDDDYSFRIRREGYKLILCKDTFIHHFGNTSFKEVAVNYNSLLEENSKKFEEKWGFNSSYSTNIRTDIINLIDVPKDKKMNILEVGCACGGTLLKIKDIYRNTELFGIEFNENAAAFSSQFANVKAENIENEILDYPTEFFDYIIFADVIEHLYNPWKVLENIRKYLKEDGKVLLSIPNVMHYSLLRHVINGHWTYMDSGLLDRTHVRFFTLQEIEKMLKEADYKDIHCEITYVGKTEQDESFIQALTELSKPEMKMQYEAYQYLVAASKQEGQKFGLVDLLLKLESNLENPVDDLLSQLEKFNVVDIIEKISRNIENKIEILNLLAIDRIEKENYEEGILYLESAFSIDNSDTDTLYNLVVVLKILGEIELARKYIVLIKEKDEEILRLYRELQEENPLYHKLLSIEDGKSELEEIIHLLHKDSSVLKEVIQIIDFDLENKINILNMLGKACYQKGLYQHSIILFQKVRDYGENSREILGDLAVALKKQKEIIDSSIIPLFRNDKKYIENLITFIICTNDERVYSECVNHILQLIVPEGFEIEVIKIDNAKSLTSAYNRAMNSSQAKYKVYIHQDALILNRNFIADLIRIFNEDENLGLLGMVGCKRLPENGVWWEAKEKYGKVIENRDTYNMLVFNEVNKDTEYVEAIDGLLMATQYDVPWREDLFDGWDLYDTSQSIEFLKSGYNVGVPLQKTPWVIHNVNSEFRESEYIHYLERFIDEYSETLGRVRAE
ncbi:TPA: glycosyltransferase [Bacillus cereus]|nr:glycosyltransferase [Bacillus cereus]HDR8024549.1 glycosyltransferase [Bacillus cereus]